MKKQSSKFVISLVSTLVISTKQKAGKSQIWDVLGMQSLKLGKAW